MVTAQQYPTGFSQRITRDDRLAWARYETDNARSVKEYRTLPTTNKHALIDLAMQDASEESHDGRFTVADIATRVPEFYVAISDIATRVQSLCTEGLLGIQPRAAKNGAHRYGFQVVSP